MTDEHAGFVRHRSPSVALPGDPLGPVPFDAADRNALKALRDGIATEDQQRRALGWIMFACGDHDLPWRPGGAEGARASDLMAGRMFVGLQIRRLLSMTSTGGQLGEHGTPVKSAEDMGEHG